MYFQNMHALFFNITFLRIKPEVHRPDSCSIAHLFCFFTFKNRRWQGWTNNNQTGAQLA